MISTGMILYAAYFWFVLISLEWIQITGRAKPPAKRLEPGYRVLSGAVAYSKQACFLVVLLTICHLLILYFLFYVFTR